MTADVQLQERAATLFFERWQEALTTAFPSHRARTVSASAALDEALALADSFVRSGGVTRASADPAESGHGVGMLPDVASEALAILRNDPILKKRFSARETVLAEAIERLKAKENVTTELVEQIRALVMSLRERYLEAGFDEAEKLVSEQPKHQGDIERLSGAIVSELRYQGWSDEGLREAAQEALEQGPDKRSAIPYLRSRTLARDRSFVCFVSVELRGQKLTFPDGQGLSLVETLPEAKRTGRTVKDGPQVKVSICAPDMAAAAGLAHRRVLSTLGAATIFLPGAGIQVASEVVAVEAEPGMLRAFAVQERLPEEKRRASAEEITNILASSWRASASPSADPLHDAIRLRHRAMMAADAESRLLLLWSGLERLTAGARGHGGALSAARELTSRAVTLGKLRREIGDLTAVLEQEVAQDPPRQRDLLERVGSYSDVAGRVHLDRAKVLELLLGSNEKLRELLSVFYEDKPLLVWRFHALWKDLGEGDERKRGDSIAGYHERSQERVSWQVARIYRARNRIAHIGVGPERMRDLAWHAHFYLTQLVAICVHYSERGETRAQDVLLRRAGQYDAMIKLLKADDPIALSTDTLLRPVVLFQE